VSELWRTLGAILRDPRISASLVLGLLSATGLGFVLAAYWGTADEALVVFQLPYVVSGGLGGIALLGIGLSLLSTHLDRASRAEERQALAQIRIDTMRLTKALSQRTHNN
jgi:hypothetical protein